MSSYGRETFSEEKMKLIEDCQSEFELYMSYIQIKDYIYTPTGIYSDVMDYAKEHGDHYHIHKETKEISVLQENYDYKEWNYHSYKPHNPKAFVNVIVDHVSLLAECRDSTTGEMMNKHQTLSKWSVSYMRNIITKKLGYMCVNVQQQTAAAENVDHVKAKMIIPSLSNLADNKLTAREAYIVLGVFSPARFRQVRWKDKSVTYDLTKFYKEYGTDAWRSLYVLKNRIGISDVQIPFRFNGRVNHFHELTDLEKSKYI